MRLTLAIKSKGKFLYYLKRKKTFKHCAEVTVISAFIVVVGHGYIEGLHSIRQEQFFSQAKR